MPQAINASVTSLSNASDSLLPPARIFHASLPNVEAVNDINRRAVYFGELQLNLRGHK